jgi:hypothetical protein
VRLKVNVLLGAPTQLALKRGFQKLSVNADEQLVSASEMIEEGVPVIIENRGMSWCAVELQLITHHVLMPSDDRLNQYEVIQLSRINRYLTTKGHPGNPSLAGRAMKKSSPEVGTFFLKSVFAEHPFSA